MVIEGLPQLPELWFMSGDSVFLVRDAPISRNGIPYRRCYMILTEKVMARYGIQESDLNYELSEYGIYVREYQTAQFQQLTYNPESPVILVSCNFDGTIITDNEISAKNNEISRYKEHISLLLEENRRLSEELKTKSQQLQVLKNES